MAKFIRILSFDKNNQLLDIAEPKPQYNGKFWRRAMRDKDVAWVRVQDAGSHSLASGRNFYKQEV